MHIYTHTYVYIYIYMHDKNEYFQGMIHDNNLHKAFTVIMNQCILCDFTNNLFAQFFLSRDYLDVFVHLAIPEVFIGCLCSIRNHVHETHPNLAILE